ncbi:Ig-like domain-containing protein, partial [uncultured Sneathiella sp.]|uniref:Ig-like domain-containing protein n=1 Tax=uncultured Sneathiella sp. TaxID=879315 RepID=UPI00259384FB
MASSDITRPSLSTVAVGFQDVIQIPFDDLAEITFIKIEDNLVITGSDDSRIVLQKFFLTHSGREQPIIQVGNSGPILTIHKITSLIKNIDDKLFESEEDKRSITGAKFSEFDPGEINGGLTISDLLNSTELTLPYFSTETRTDESLAGNPGSGDTLAGTVDLVPPTLTITAADFDLAEGEATAVTFEFSEDVAGFTQSDVTLTGGTLSDFT